MLTRKDAYEYLLREKQGEKNEIIAQIGEELFNELRLVGYIKEGMDGNWVERWQITHFGKSQINAYSKLNEIDVELDDICGQLQTSY